MYDANGNLITGDGKFRTYDGFNHLVQVRNGDNATATILENYTWHPIEDRILAKSVYETNGSWKEDVLYISKEYVIVDNASGSFDYRYYYQNGQLVAQEDYSGRKLFMHNDHLGSVSLVTNESGAVVEQTFYSPFGEILSGGEASRYDYTGKEFDSVTGDYDFNARKMDPSKGVFTTPDGNLPNIFDSQQLNRYSYVMNNPFKYFDPNGKDAWLAIAPTQAAGRGHVALVIGNPDINYKAYSQGAIGGTEETGTGPSVLFKTYQGGVYISPESKSSPEEALGDINSDGSYIKTIHFKTTPEQDLLMQAEAEKQQREYEEGKRRYQVITQNCADFTTDVLNKGGVKTQYWNPIPNSYFEKAESKYSKSSTGTSGTSRTPWSYIVTTAKNEIIKKIQWKGGVQSIKLGSSKK